VIQTSSALLLFPYPSILRVLGAMSPSHLFLKHADTFPSLIRGSAEIRSCNLTKIKTVRGPSSDLTMRVEGDEIYLFTGICWHAYVFHRLK
jgi:hypothetical protein